MDQCWGASRKSPPPASYRLHSSLQGTVPPTLKPPSRTGWWTAGVEEQPRVSRHRWAAPGCSTPACGCTGNEGPVLPRFAAKWSHCASPARRPWWRTTQEAPGRRAFCERTGCMLCSLPGAQRPSEQPAHPHSFPPSRPSGLSMEPGMWVQEGTRSLQAGLAALPGVVGPASAWGQQEQREGF